MIYSVNIEKDTNNVGKYVVVVTAQRGTSATGERIIGTLIRGVTYKTAETIRIASLLAFEHGMKEQRARFIEFAQKENENTVDWGIGVEELKEET